MWSCRANERSARFSGSIRSTLALTLTPDPELTLLPEDVLRGQGTQLADAEAGVEQPPDDNLLGGRLAGGGQLFRFLGGEGLADVLVGHLAPRILRLWSRKVQ
jgi:hypothetical protein